MFERPALDELPRDRSIDLAVLLETLSDRGELAGDEVTKRFYEIGSPAGLADPEHHLNARR